MGITHKKRDTLARKALYLVTKLLRSTWGLSGNKFCHLYLAVIEPILLCGCSLWTASLKTKSESKKTRSWQRNFLIINSQSFKSVSTKVLCVLCKSLPLDFKVEERSAIRYLPMPHEFFSSATFKWLSNILLALATVPKIDPVRSVSGAPVPPWDQHSSYPPSKSDLFQSNSQNNQNLKLKPRL